MHWNALWIRTGRSGSVGKEKNNKTIVKPNIILCEGEDTTLFIIWYLEHLREREKGFEGFWAYDFGGNEELSIFLSDIKKYPGYDHATSITILHSYFSVTDDFVSMKMGEATKAGAFNF